MVLVYIGINGAVGRAIGLDTVVENQVFRRVLAEDDDSVIGVNIFVVQKVRKTSGP